MKFSSRTVGVHCIVNSHAETMRVRILLCAQVFSSVTQAGTDTLMAMFFIQNIISSSPYHLYYCQVEIYIYLITFFVMNMQTQVQDPRVCIQYKTEQGCHSSVPVHSINTYKA